MPPAYSDDGYQFAAAASEIWLNPLGGVAIVGPGGSNLYYKGLLDKLGVTANVYRVGTYKSAVEPYIRNDMSPEAKENYQAFADALLESWRENVIKARPAAKVDAYMRDMPGALDAAGGDLGKAALAAGLVDKLGDRRAFEARLAGLGGADDGETGGYNRIKLKSTSTTGSNEPARPDRHRDHRRDHRRRQGGRQALPPATASPRRSSAACATADSRRWWCASTAPADR